MVVALRPTGNMSAIVTGLVVAPSPTLVRVTTYRSQIVKFGLSHKALSLTEKLVGCATEETIHLGPAGDANAGDDARLMHAVTARARE
jgi:hypothetical protein